MNRLFNRTFALLAALLTGALVTLPDVALAQLDEGQPTASVLEEILVTARRREEALSDIPIAASVLDGEMLLRRGPPTATRELLSGVPGLRFNDTTSPTTSELSMRGSGTGRGTSADSGVGLYRNGVYIGGGFQYGRNFLRIDMFDLDRVEVLRGTQGALYGRNAVGGTINLISAKPRFEREWRVELDYNSTLEGTQAQAVINEALSDSFAVRAGIDWVDQAEGFYYNIPFDRYLDEQSGYGARLQFRYAKGGLDANLLLENQDFSVSSIGAALDIPPTPPDFPLGYEDEQYAYNWSVPGTADLEMPGAILEIQYDFGWATLSSTTSYRDRHGVTVSDVDNFSEESRAEQQALGNPMTFVDPGQNLLADDDTETLYQELHLTGEAGNLAWLAGAEYINLDSTLLVGFARTPGFLGVPLPGVDTYQFLEYTSVAPYVSLDYAITGRWSIIGELRYTEDQKDYSTYRTILDTDTVIVPLSTINSDFSNTSYNVIVSYDFSDSVMVYGKVGTGYRVGGFNTVVTVPNQPNPVPPTYDNEESITYELGMKGHLTDNFYLAVAAYIADTDGVLVNDNNGCSLANACGQNPTSFTTNGGTATVKGVELEFNSAFDFIGGELTPSVGVSRQHGTIESGLQAGFEVPQTPDWIAFANLDFAAPVGSSSELELGLHYSAQWGGTQDVVVPVFDMADRQVVDIYAGVAFGNWKVSAYLNNALDDEYYVLRQPTLYRWNGDRRNGGVRVRFTW